VSLRNRAIWVGVAALVMALLAYPSFFSEERRLASPWISDQGINLGLDLQGGIHWLIHIDVGTAVQQEMARAEGVLREEAEVAGVSVAGLSLREDGTLELGVSAERLREIAAEVLPSLEGFERDGRSGLRLTEEWHREVVRRGVRQAQEVLRERVDDLGVREPVIAPQGEGRILVQMAGDVDPGRARGILEETTFLEFKLVLAAADNEDLLRAGYPDGLPEGTVVVVARNEDGSVSEAFVVPETPVLTGAMLEDARFSFDNRNRAVVSFTWNSEGTVIFREFTTAHIGERLAAIIDGEVVTAPSIRGRIGKRGQIEGDFTQQEAADLAVKLRSGALPIPLEIEEERQVGPALGADSIRHGVRAILLGGVLVIAFMVVYYRVSGALANLALLLNLVIIIALMGSAGATLTLPGIAGLVLTLGMAVDANVIIFERVREELRSGKSVRNAVQIGFRRSALTIFDANVTTMIAAVVLLYLGRGPVQGFGVTLAIGILSSVFCALVVTRLLVDLALSRHPGRLSI
jgi:preprotein translocase subunit SecD